MRVPDETYPLDAVIVAPAVLVRLSNRGNVPKRGPLRVYRDDGPDGGHVSAFLKWCCDEEVFPVAGGTSGPGFHEGAYDAGDAEAIRSFLRGRGLEVEG